MGIADTQPSLSGVSLLHHNTIFSSCKDTSERSLREGVRPTASRTRRRQGAITLHQREWSSRRVVRQSYLFKSSADMDNTHTIPTHQPVSSVERSPVDRSNTSPGSPPETPPSNPSSGQDLAEPLPEQNKTPDTVALPRWLAQGITGSDLALPFFDGTSKNKDDHFHRSRHRIDGVSSGCPSILLDNRL